MKRDSELAVRAIVKNRDDFARMGETVANMLRDYRLMQGGFHGEEVITAFADVHREAHAAYFSDMLSGNRGYLDLIGRLREVYPDHAELAEAQEVVQGVVGALESAVEYCSHFE